MSERRLDVTDADETIASYPLDRVRVTRVASDRFEIDVGQEQLVFVADDAIRFSYEGMPAIEAARSLGQPLVERVGDWLRSLAAGRVDEAPLPPTPQVHRSVPYAAPEMRWRPRGATLAPEHPSAAPAGTADWANDGLPLEIPSGDDGSSDLEHPLAPVAAASVGGVTCVGIRSDGKPCGSTAVGPGGLCFAHDPARYRERQRVEEQTVLAAERVRKSPTENLGDVVARLERAVAEVHEGRLDPQRALAMASLAQAMIDTIEFAKSEEARDRRT